MLLLWYPESNGRASKGTKQNKEVRFVDKMENILLMIINIKG